MSTKVIRKACELTYVLPYIIKACTNGECATDEACKRCCGTPLLRKKVTGEKVPVIKLKLGTYVRSIAEFHLCELSILATNASSPLALCTGHRCAAIQQPLRTHASRLALFSVMVAGGPMYTH